MRTDALMSVADQVPKVIEPGAHAVLDYLTAGGFLAMGFAMRQRHPRASMLAFVNGAAVLGLSLMTDYPGGVWKKISFQTHGVVDAVQAMMTAAGPALMGFAGDPEAQAFHAQAAMEMGIVAATNFETSAA